MKKLIKKMAANQFFQGSFIFTASNFIISVLNYFFNFLVGRALGPAGYGEITAFFSYTAIFSIPFAIATFLIIQKIGSANGNNYIYVKSVELWFIDKIKKWWFLFFLLILFIPLISPLTNVSFTTSLLIIITIILSSFSVFYFSALQGLKFFAVIALINTISISIKFIGSILVTLHIDGLTTIFLCLLAATIFNLLASFFSFKKLVCPSSVFKKIEKRIVHVIFNKFFYLTAISTISLILLTNFDIIFVKKFFSAKEAGLFSAWTLFSKIIFYLVSPIVGLTFVFFSSKKNDEEQNKIFMVTLLILIAVGSFCFVLYSFFPSLVQLMFGDKFNSIIKFLPSAAILGIAFSSINLFNNYFLAKKSLLVLILPSTFVLYISLLFLSRANLANVMKTDIFFELAITIIYLAAYFLKKRRGYI